MNINSDFLSEMLKNNKIKELVDYEIKEGDIKFKTENYQKMIDVKKSGNDIKKILKSILLAYESLQNYMIDEYIELDEDKVYLDNDFNIYFILSQRKNTGINELIRKIMFNRQIGKDEDIEMYRDINNSLFCESIDIRKIINIISKESDFGENKRNDKIIKESFVKKFIKKYGAIKNKGFKLKTESISFDYPFFSDYKKNKKI